MLRGRLKLGADMHLNPDSLDDLGDSVGLTKTLCFHFFQCNTLGNNSLPPEGHRRGWAGGRASEVGG